MIMDRGRHGGLMVSALNSGASGPGSSPGRGHCVVFLGKTLTLTVPLSIQVYKWVPANCWENLTDCGEVTCNGLASHPGEVEIPLATLYATETGINSDSYEPVLAPWLHLLLIKMIIRGGRGQ